jgi:hypothetical protein
MPTPQADLARSLAAPQRDMGVLPLPHRDNEDLLDKIMKMIYGPLPSPPSQRGDINLPAPSAAEQFMEALKARGGVPGVSLIKRKYAKRPLPR